MAKNTSHKPAFVLAAAALSLAVAGCGGSKSSGGGATTVPKGIYTTAADCADSGKLTYEQCSDLISKAVDTHEKDAPTYSELRFCEAKEGDGKCEFTANQKIRPKLLAFLVTVSDPPQAIPLYAHSKGEPGFRDLAGGTYMHANEELVFSEHAVTVFEKNGKKKRRF